MQYQSIIKSILSEKWQYFSNKELLVLAIGNESHFSKQGLINADGSLKPQFKDELTSVLAQQKLLINHIGPFGDTDYFSGIEDENNQLQYFFEIHRISQADAINFSEYYPVIFIKA